jgi:UDPglucose 6-dehydrogenase
MKDGTTGDTDFFNRCRAGGVEIVKALNSISYHCGGIETYRNESFIGKLKIKISANLPDSVKKVLRKYIKRRLSIGIIGLGVVGEAMRCGFEEKQGHRVRVVGHDKKYKTSIENVFNNSDLIFITVSTPTGPDGACDVSAVESVCRDLNKLAKKMSIKKDVVIKSTVEPGTTDRLAKELKNLRFAFNPEFLKERSAFSDFVNQDICVIGTKHNDLYRKFVYIYGNLAKEFIRTTPLNAEFLKYFLNVFNSTRIIFANLFYDLVSKMGGNYKEVKSMAVKRHNMIDYYLDCGEGMRGFGGKCLPKDTLAIQAFAKKMGVNYAFLEGLLADNERLNREYPQRPEFMDNGKSL